MKALLGLSHMQDSGDYYKILEVSTKATAEEIKEAYRRLVRKYHPDLHPGNLAAEERFKEICKAYEILSDSVERSQYDQRFRHKKSKPQGMSPQDFYVRAIGKALERDYPGAVADYTQAIEGNPRFVEAYLERGATRYKLGDARGSLQDCNQALQINPNLAQAYYYQGRARYKLGYTSAAIKAYSKAIHLKPDYAQVYYHRGLANHELEDNILASEDLQKAAELFRKQGDKTGYQLAQATLTTLQDNRGKFKKSSRKNPPAAVKSLLTNLVQVSFSLVVNPAGGMLSGYANLEKRQALAVGIVFAGIFNFCFVFWSYVGWRNIFEAYLWELMSVGLVPFFTLVAIGSIARVVSRSSGSLAGDIYLAGASLLPLGFLALASSGSTVLGSQVMLIIGVFASCYTVLILYSGCTQISGMSDTVAALTLPVMLLVSGWLTYLAVTVIL
ncbi:DnaJ domain-containing protein [Lyngbya aestuarii]|uniref:DnaJ domain-containing protein n=1 Tax=Lyngbya aestuarii TaxID=118322 RepID=UPI00403DA5A1